MRLFEVLSHLCIPEFLDIGNTVIETSDILLILRFLLLFDSNQSVEGSILVF